MSYLLLFLFAIISIQAQQRPFGIITSSECEQLRSKHEYASLIAGIHASAKQGSDRVSPKGQSGADLPEGTTARILFPAQCAT